jgi:hypothetical protein
MPAGRERRSNSGRYTTTGVMLAIRERRHSSGRYTTTGAASRATIAA